MSKQKARGAYITRRIKTLSKKLDAYSPVWQHVAGMLPYLDERAFSRLKVILPTQLAAKGTRISVGDAVVEVFDYFISGMWLFHVDDRIEDAGNTANGREALMEGLRALVEHLERIEEDAIKRLDGTRVEARTWLATGNSPWKMIK